MNDLQVVQQKHRIPGWAFLLGWWFCLTGIVNVFNGGTGVIRTYPGLLPNSSFTSFTSVLWFGMDGLLGIAFLLAGIILLYRHTRWKRFVQAIAILMLLEWIMDFAHPNLSRLTSDMVTARYVVGHLPNALTALGPAFVLFWMTAHLEKARHPDITALACMLLLPCIENLHYPLSTIIQTMDGNTFGTSTSSEYLIKLILMFSPVVYPILLLTCAVAVRRKLPTILFTRYLLLVLGGVLTLWILLQLAVIRISNLEMTFESMTRSLAEVSMVFTNYLLPPVLVFIMVMLYADSFRLAELYKYGFNNCCFCGYDMTGNTTGICPECGKYPYPAPDALQGKQNKDD